MKFRTYCMVIMGDTTGIQKILKKISEIEPNILDAKGIIIATFISALNVKEITDIFKDDERNFLLFDLNDEYSGFNILKKEINDGLFGFLKTFNSSTLENKTIELLKEINLTSKVDSINSSYKSKVKKNKITESDIAKMSKSEREGFLNEMIDNGIENLTEYDKKIIELLAK